MKRPKRDASASPAAARLFSKGKKRVLALDGGGVRGIVSIAFLRRMEELLRQETGRKELVLSDVFDLIGGTSVGSMLATMLAMGRETSEVEALFRDLAPKIFSGRETIFGQRRFSALPLVNGVRSIVKEETLGSDKLITGLMIVAKRVDTDSIWIMSNNPDMPYFEDGESWDGNKRYKLENIIRASTAAPFLFTPTEIKIHTDRSGKVVTGTFIDGGVSPHNNPSLQLLLMTALPAYNLQWTISPDDLMLISVGTGYHRAPVDRSRRVIQSRIAGAFLPRNVREDIEEAAFAAQTLRCMVGESGVFVLKVMQSLSRPRFSWKINGEVGNLENDFVLSAVRGLADRSDLHALLRFQRYDLPLETALVDARYDVSAAQDVRVGLRAIDDPGILDKLYELSTEAARKQVAISDFAGFI